MYLFIHLFLSFQYVRIGRIQPFGQAIHTAFQVFLDEKDAGGLVLTHIYLLLGCAVPLWLFPMSYRKVTQPSKCRLLSDPG